MGDGWDGSSISSQAGSKKETNNITQQGGLGVRSGMGRRRGGGISISGLQTRDNGLQIHTQHKRGEAGSGKSGGTVRLRKPSRRANHLKR